MRLTMSNKAFLEMSQDDNAFIDVNHMSDDLKNSLEQVGLNEERLKEVAHEDGKITGKEFKELFKAVDGFDSNGSGSSFQYYDKSATPESPTLSKSGILYEAMSMEVEKNRIVAGFSGPDATGKQKPLSEGSKGTEVREAQHQINQWRQDQGKKLIKENGEFGREMKEAVRDFQEGTGLKPDAIFGNNVRERLTLTNDENFKHLKASRKKEIFEKLNEYEKDPKSRDNLRQLATDPYFTGLSTEGQAKALNRFANDPQSPSELKTNQAEVKDRYTLERNHNFKRLDDSIKQQALNSFDSYALNPDSRKQYIDFASDGRLGKLPLKYQGEALKTMQSLAKPSDPGNTENLQNAKNFQRVALSSSFRNMDDPVKDRVLNATKKGDPKLIADLARLTNDDSFIRMTKPDQVKTLSILESTTPAGRKSLLTILDKKVGIYPALESKGLKTTGSLIDQLDRLNTSTLDPRVGDSTGIPANKTKVMEGLLEELANPSAYIDQHGKGTCTCTSMSFDMAAMKPAEYARIVTDLATTGKSKVANGDTIQPPADGFAYDGTNRSVGERLIQSSLMDYGFGGTYSNVKDVEGLDVDQQIKVLDAITGKKHSQVIDRNHIMITTRDYLDGGRGPVYARFNWDDGGHAVEIVKVDKDRIYFRNPWGGYLPGVSEGVGTPDVYGRPLVMDNGKLVSAGGPNRKIEDGANAIESISIDDFLITVRSVVVEDLPD